MVIAFAILLVVHGLIHLLGTAKACGWAEPTLGDVQYNVRASMATRGEEPSDVDR